MRKIPKEARNEERKLHCQLLSHKMDLSQGSVDPHSLHSQLVPFVGSAVSLFEPTSLPSWGGFVDSLLSGLSKAAGEEKPATESIPFYSVTEILSRRLGVKYLEVMSGLLHRPANAAHEMLVENMLKGRYPAVVSTNFDRVIEDELIKRGASMCELFGDDEAADNAALEAQLAASKDGDVRVVVLVGSRACSCLSRMPGLIGQDGVCLVIKIHGDAKFPETCIDTELQREKGLPSHVRSALTILLRRYAFFFVGFSGGDLDHNMNYIRLRSEADKAQLYWLLMPDAAEPLAFAEIRKTFEAQGGSLTVVRGLLQGSISGNADAFRSAVEYWAVKEIGKEWAALALEDVLQYDGTIPRTLVSEARSMLAVVPESSDDFARDHRAMASACVEAVEALNAGDTAAAWTKAVLGMRTAQRMLASNPLQFADAWAPFVAGALACSKVDLAMAAALMADALTVSQLSGNRTAAEFLEKHQIQLEDDGPEETGDEGLEEEQIADDEKIRVFVLGLDSTGAAHPSGLPGPVVMRAELFRAVLVSDTVVMPANVLLDSKELVCDVLFNPRRMPRRKLLGLLVPLIDQKFKSEDRPLVAIRNKWVANPNFMNQDVPDELISKMQDFFLAKRTSPIYLDYAPLGKAYAKRVALSMTPANAPPEICDPLKKFVAAVAGENQERGLTRSDMYRWGDLFPQKPTSDDDLFSSLSPEAREAYETKEELIGPRAAALRRPWKTARTVKTIADGPYSTNLPSFYGFSMTVSQDNEAMVAVVREALKQEKGSSALSQALVVSPSTIDAAALAGLTVEEVLELRESPEGYKFRKCTRLFNSDPCSKNRKAMDAVAKSFGKMLSDKVAGPYKRVLVDTIGKPKDEAQSPQNGIELEEYMLGSLSPAMSKPPLPQYNAFELRFPALLPQPSAKKPAAAPAKKPAVAPANSKGSLLSRLRCFS